MTPRDTLTTAITVVGDREIARILDQETVVSYPAIACRYDGFVDDVFSEYANPSIVRSPSVRQARIRSELSARFDGGEDRAEGPATGEISLPESEQVRHDFYQVRHLPRAGDYYIGWTMYDTAGAPENVTVWLGAQEVAYVPSSGNDNRLHLYILTQPFRIDYGERLRLVTDANGSPYRFEKIVLLRALPTATAGALQIHHVSAEVEEHTAGVVAVRLNWRTSRPAQCTVRYGETDHAGQVVQEALPLANHSLVLPGAVPAPAVWFEISGQTPAGETASSGELRLIDLLPARGTQAQSGRIPLTVVNRLDRVATAWPVTWGLPFSRSALWNLDHCRLVGSDGRVLPCQKRVQVSWDDGSIRWALLDFQIDLAAGAREALALEYGPDVSDGVTGPDMGVVSAPGSLMVDAGRLRLTFSREQYAFPAGIELRGADGWRPVAGTPGDLSAIALVDAAGKRYDVGGALDEIDVEESGPLRTTVRLVARHRTADGSALLRSILRVSAYRDMPFLRVQHTFENDDVEHTFTHIRSLSLGANLASGWVEQAWNGDATFSVDGSAVRLLQPLPDRFEVCQDGAMRGQGEHAPGWWAVSGREGAVAIAMRDFWQNAPKGWEAGPAGVRIDICPDVRNITYPSADDLASVRTFFYLQEGQYKLKRGLARTHDLLFVVAPSVTDIESPIHLFATPPLVRFEPGLFERNRVLSPLCARDQAGAEAYDQWCDSALAIYELDRSERQAYGMLNFGDWYGERRYNWGNMEYDTPYGFLLEYLRGGSDRYFTLGWQAAWHLADVDTCHHHADPGKAGRQYGHSLGHVGGYYPEGYLPMAMAGEYMSWTHTWVEGLYLYALLTGERRLWEVATRAVETLAAADLNDYDFTNCRDCGWPLRHLIGTYQATGRKRFLNGATIIVERVLERQRRSGGWERLLVPGHCYHVPPRHMGNAGFMVGVLLAALKRFHEETEDAAVGQAIVDAAHYLIHSMWEAGHGAFRYTSCPRSAVAGELNTQILEGIGYAWRLSGDETLKQTLLVGLAVCLTTPADSTTPPVGKDISARMRNMPFIMHAVLHAGGSPATG